MKTETFYRKNQVNQRNQVNQKIKNLTLELNLNIKNLNILKPLYRKILEKITKT